jgi:hypothetical protein
VLDDDAAGVAWLATADADCCAVPRADWAMTVAGAPSATSSSASSRYVVRRHTRDPGIPGDVDLS